MTSAAIHAARHGDALGDLFHEPLERGRLVARSVERLVERPEHAGIEHLQARIYRQWMRCRDHVARRVSEFFLVADTRRFRL